MASLWFHWDLKEHEYQLSKYECLAALESNESHLKYWKEMIVRIKHDIKYLSHR